MNKKIAIIGAGASGIIAAIKLSKYFEVVLFEKMPRIGKKIIASGNGKCNLTNMTALNNDTYNNEFAVMTYDIYTPEQFRKDLLNLGIITITDKEQRVYPITNSSNSVIDNFLYHLEQNNVNIQTDTLVSEIRKTDNYEIITDKKVFKGFDYVIVSTGGKASRQLGSNGEGYKLLENLGVKVTKTNPGLVGLKVNQPQLKGLDGIRQKARVTLKENNQIIYQELGEVQFKKDGISGIVVMNASSIMARKNKYTNVYLDLVPNLTKDELNIYLNNIKHLNPNMEIVRILRAVLPKMLALNIYDKLGEVEISKYIEYIKNMSLSIVDTYGFDNAQVTVGGIKTSEITKEFELNQDHNIYVIGELLDVDGLCGGYNLHFSMASGRIASKSILKKEGINHE